MKRYEISCEDTSSIEEAKSCIEKARQQYHGDYASDGYRQGESK